MNIYDFEAQDNQGNRVPLAQFKGKVLLVVNTATKCGLTSQYEGLEALYQKYGNQGFEVLDFPSNQFLKQAPGTDAEIESFCTLNYNTTFPRFGKINVNGQDIHPLYGWLKEQAPEDEGDKKAKVFNGMMKVIKPLAKANDIKWNFGKFLINRDGEVVGRFAPTVTPDKLEAAIEACLNSEKKNTL